MGDKRLKQIFFVVLVLLAGATNAWCAEELHETRWGDFGWRVLNLILFCAILWYFTGKIIKRFFKNRRQSIIDTLDDLQKRRERSRAELADIEKRIANLEAERKAILDESRAQAERLRAGIIDDAKRQASQIVDQARQAAENESRALLNQVRGQVADEIVEAADKALRGKLTDADHQKLISKALDKVSL